MVCEDHTSFWQRENFSNFILQKLCYLFQKQTWYHSGNICGIKLWKKQFKTEKKFRRSKGIEKVKINMSKYCCDCNKEIEEILLEMYQNRNRNRNTDFT